MDSLCCRAPKFEHLYIVDAESFAASEVVVVKGSHDNLK